MQPIPAIDLKDGRCVRLYKGHFDAVSHYEPRPEELAARYLTLGAEWLHLVDLDGARDGDRRNRAVVHGIAALAPGRVQVGGGVRRVQDVETLLAFGAGRVVIGSAAVERPEEVCDWLNRFGAERIVLAFDVRIDADGVRRVQSRGWTRDSGLVLDETLAAWAEAGAIHVLCTDAGRDGTMTGPNTELYADCVARFPTLRVQASGGVRDHSDLEALRAAGATAAIIGRALLEGRITDEELRTFLPAA